MQERGFAPIIIIVIVAVAVLALGGAGYVVVKKKAVGPQLSPTPRISPAVSPSPQVSPTPQTSPAPSILPVLPTVEVPITIVPPSEQGLAPYPDLKIEEEIPAPMTVKYLIEHRSALNGKTVRVRGIVVANWLTMKCPEIVMFLCPQPRIFLADSAEEGRNPHYDLDVYVGEEARGEDYPTGKTAEITGEVNGYNTGVSLLKK